MGLRVAEVAARARRPEPFEPSEAPFWDDPYISGELLKSHFDDTTEAASRPFGMIVATVDRLVRDGVVSPGTRVLDLGCGPGRYSELLASVGCHVTGVDLSPRSIAHARERAAQRGLDVDYRVADFRTLEEVAAYDVVLQVYGELATFSDAVRDDVLARVRRALVPHGWLVFDVSTPSLRARVGAQHQDLACLLLESLDPLADGRGRHVQPPRGGVEAALLDHRGECVEPGRVEVHPPRILQSDSWF